MRLKRNAFREVHDALVTNAAARDMLAAETDRADKLQRALAVANFRYESGVTGFLERPELVYCVEKVP